MSIHFIQMYRKSFFFIQTGLGPDSDLMYIVTFCFVFFYGGFNLACLLAALLLTLRSMKSLSIHPSIYVVHFYCHCTVLIIYDSEHFFFRVHKNEFVTTQCPTWLTRLHAAVYKLRCSPGVQLWLVVRFLEAGNNFASLRGLFLLINASNGVGGNVPLLFTDLHTRQS